MTSELLLRRIWNNNILVLGKGYLGGFISNHLAKHYNVKCVSSHDLNYHDSKTLSKYLKINDIEVIINCSGFTGRPNVDEGESRKEECWDLNVVSPTNINILCNTLGVKYIHISSGCIYSGYDKEYTELDKPNFGLFDISSFYSKSKHGFELASKNLANKILRIRMPISPDDNPRNYINKILNYDNLIDYKNSKTYIPDLCEFIDNLLQVDTIGFWKGQDIYNIVNPNPLTTSDVCEIMKNSGKYNKNWKFVDIDNIPIIAPRSNCVLDGSKADSIYQMRNETEIIEESLKYV